MEKQNFCRNFYIPLFLLVIYLFFILEQYSGWFQYKLQAIVSDNTLMSGLKLRNGLDEKDELEILQIRWTVSRIDVTSS
jgi:hypothetical protein